MNKSCRTQALLCALLWLTGCAKSVVPDAPLAPPAPTPQPLQPIQSVIEIAPSPEPTAPPILIVADNTPTPPALPDFATWLVELRREAQAAGISVATLDAALTGIQPIERVIELDKKQPESMLTFEEYLARVIPASRVQAGREKLGAQRKLLAKVSTQYHVPARILVALWGVETDYGRLVGNFSVVNALATLAYEGRRAAFFRNELLESLHILNNGDISAEAMRGSWAGAMGQSQFMPSTYRKYAVDQNGDGKRDIWNQPADVFASAANYLSQIGWVHGQNWGREVRLPKNFDPGLVGLEQRKSMAQWKALGVRRVDNTALPIADWVASVIQPSGPGGRAFLVYDNFRVLLQWNRSTYFGVSVGLLADALEPVQVHRKRRATGPKQRSGGKN